jgi:hypothetical protein
MHNNKYIIQLLIITACMFAANTIVKGQGNTVYYMGTLPQSYFMNPATQPQCDVYIGLPVASQINARVTTGSLSAGDFFFKDPLSDSVITWTHPNADPNDLLAKLNKVETWGGTIDFSLVSFGFRVKDMYFSFDAAVRNSITTSLSKDYFEFAWLGNENDRTYDFSDMGVEVMEYMEFGVNISRHFGDQLQIGIRPKMLFGLATISTLSNSTTLYTSTEEWVLNSNAEARFAATGVTIPVDEEGNIDWDQDFEFDSTIFSPTGYQKILSKNRGWGIDIGAHYKPIDNLQVSLSVLDLGYIKWRESTHVAEVNGTYVYDGLEADSVFDGGDFGQALLDTLKENLNVTQSAGTFTTTLNPKLFVGARYFLTPGFDIGILSRTEFLPSYINQDLLLLANWHPIPMISISGSYNLLSKTHSTFGLGLGLKLGPFNVYTVLEDVPFKYDIVREGGAPIPLPVEQNNYNVRFGVNLVFGCNQKKKQKNNKPLFNSSDWIL